MTPMRSIELDDEEMLDQAYPAMPEKPRYPYGTAITLNEKTCAAIGADPADFEKDGIIHLHALARITNVTHSDGEMGKTCRVELQIEDMSIESEDAENREADKKTDAASLYDNKRSERA